MFYVKLVPAILKLINCFAKKQYAFLQHPPLERRIIDNWIRELLVTQASKQASKEMWLWEILADKWKLHKARV